METWPDREGRIVLTENVNKSEDGEEEDESKPERTDIGARVCGEGKEVGSVVAFFVGCSSEEEAVEGLVNIFVRRVRIEGLDEREFLGKVA